MEPNPAAEPAKTKKNSGKPFLIAIFAITVVVSLGAYFYTTYDKRNYVKTNNASVQCDMITIASKMSGNIIETKVKQGDYIHKGEVIMELDPAVMDAAQIDYSYIRATTDGTVLKVVGAPGQSVSLGQTVAYLAVDTDTYIICNIDEKDMNKIEIGQDVDITVDQFGNTQFPGKVTEVGSATQSAFSIVSSTSSGSFVKVTQHAPVKVKFVQPNDGLLIGANATVRIHIK